MSVDKILLISIKEEPSLFGGYSFRKLSSQPAGAQMEEFFKSLNGIEIFFLLCGSIGGLVLLIRIIMQFVGIGHDVDTDFDTHGGDAGHISADTSFQLLSVHGLTSFVMMFGLVGFALYRESALGTILSILGATAAGAITFFIIGKLFITLVKMQSSGTIDPISSVGSEGTVYLTIPAEGTGKVHVTFKNRFREYQAVSHEKEELITGERIKVVWVKGNVLVVEKTNK